MSVSRSGLRWIGTLAVCAAVLALVSVRGQADVRVPLASDQPATARMELEFLGTGAAWTIPRLDCSCHTCGAARTTSPRSKRLRASLKVGTSPFLLVDMGPDVYQQLDRLPDPRPAAILLTHIHQDHANGASDLDPLARKRPIPLLTSPLVFAELERQAPWTVPLFHFQDITTPKQVGPFAISSFRLIHGTTTVGFRVEQAGRALAYVCDVDRVPDESLPSLKNLDLMIVDGTNVGLDPSTELEASHIKPDAVLRLIEVTRPKRLVFTHVGHMAQPHEQLTDRVRKIYGGEVAYDGWKVGL